MPSRTMDTYRCLLIITGLVPAPQDVDTVAFLARKEDYQKVDKNDIIRFTRVLINYGNAYRAGSSTFVCTDRNLYAFYVNILSAQGSYAFYYIVKDGEIQGDGSTGTGPGLNNGSSMAIVQCAPGNQVWVVCSSEDDDQRIHIYHSMFAGFRIALNNA